MRTCARQASDASCARAHAVRTLRPSACPPRSRRRLPSPPQRGACRCDSRSCGAVWMSDGRLVDTNTVVFMTFCVMQSDAAGYDHTACADSLSLACRHHIYRAELYLYYGNPVRLLYVRGGVSQSVFLCVGFLGKNGPSFQGTA